MKFLGVFENFSNTLIPEHVDFVPDTASLDPRMGL